MRREVETWGGEGRGGCGYILTPPQLRRLPAHDTRSGEESGWKVPPSALGLPGSVRWGKSLDFSVLSFLICKIFLLTAVKESQLQSWTARVKILALPCINCVVLDLSVTVSSLGKRED